ncbi:MAG: MFS transporter [Clostridia bacterium]|nr:MFS transporter [Clostridia bacterium]
MKRENNTLVLVLFLLSIFMGAIDNGIVSPAREIIESGFGVGGNVGIWMITIYTLSFAVSMPIISKLSDRHGHKRIFTLSIILFGVGSLLCGLNNFFGNFQLFLAARVIQAIGAGGIMPIANTVIGLSFPEDKRGTALGFVGAVYGVATIVGPTLGSSILGAAGNENWGWIFFINIPICITILALSFYMKNTRKDDLKPMDFAGSIVIAAAIASLMYALTNLDLFNIGVSIKDTKVYPYLIAFLILIPVLILVERRAKDPVLNLKYFKDRQMLVAFLLALIVGVGMMGMIFIPQFAENVLKIKAGTGGYMVTLLAVFSGISAPLSGKFLDKKGGRFVMILGFTFTILGTLILGYIATANLNFISLLAGLALLGFGIGFTLGAPLNYIVLQHVRENEGATALATMSLIRSIGVTVSPSIMIGFVLEAAKNLQTKLSDVAQQSFASMVPPGINMKMDFGANASNGKFFESLKSADVTNVVDRLKEALGHVVPPNVQGFVSSGVEKIRETIESTFQSTLNTGYKQMFTAMAVISFVGILAALLLEGKKREGVGKE